MQTAELQKQQEAEEALQKKAAVEEENRTKLTTEEDDTPPPKHGRETYPGDGSRNQRRIPAFPTGRHDVGCHTGDVCRRRS